MVSERRPVLMELLEQAFVDLEGIPRELLIDNFKQAVEVARSAEEPAKLQQELASVADHWGFDVVACPPYWPRAKGKVERAISYLKRSFFEGREVRDLEDLNGQLRQWLAEVANVRIHGTTGERPVDRLAADQASMHSLAGRRSYPAAQRATRDVDHDARISFGGVRYSVDPQILGGRRGLTVETCVGADERLRIYRNSTPWPVFRRESKSFKVLGGGDRWMIEANLFETRLNAAVKVKAGGDAHRSFAQLR